MSTATTNEQMQEIWNFLVPIIGVESYVAASSHLFPAQAMDESQWLGVASWWLVQRNEPGCVLGEQKHVRQVG
ncbi:hypothetical protein VNO80_21672 [Phaseolus coccineus]|uniref:Uncharacterized protein n=1 Tax=Phaseolus coccineus TaxID=3886 RepID=A0AAN9M2V7_PHACN